MERGCYNAARKAVVAVSPLKSNFLRRSEEQGPPPPTACPPGFVPNIVDGMATTGRSGDRSEHGENGKVGRGNET